MHSSVSSQGAVPPWVLVGAVAFLGFAVFILEQDSVIPLWPWFPSSCICEWVPPRSSVLPSARVFAGSRAQCVKNISQENNLMGNRGREQISAVRMNSGPPAHCHSSYFPPLLWEVVWETLIWSFCFSGLVKTTNKLLINRFFPKAYITREDLKIWKEFEIPREASGEYWGLEIHPYVSGTAFFCSRNSQLNVLLSKWFPSDNELIAVVVQRITDGPWSENTPGSGLTL